MTPYIFDDRCNFTDVADAMTRWYNTTEEYRQSVGAEGRAWMMSEESGMSVAQMCVRMKRAINKCFETWKPKPKFELIAVKDREKIKEAGIVW